MAIKKLTTRGGRSRTSEVGQPFDPDDPRGGVVTSILRQRSGAYKVSTDGQGSDYIAPHRINLASIVSF